VISPCYDQAHLSVWGRYLLGCPSLELLGPIDSLAKFPVGDSGSGPECDGFSLNISRFSIGLIPLPCPSIVSVLLLEFSFPSLIVVPRLHPLRLRNSQCALPLLSTVIQCLVSENTIRLVILLMLGRPRFVIALLPRRMQSSLGFRKISPSFFVEYIYCNIGIVTIILGLRGWILFVPVGLTSILLRWRSISI
jgi:hypothetical protein